MMEDLKAFLDENKPDMPAAAVLLLKYGGNRYQHLARTATLGTASRRWPSVRHALEKLYHEQKPRADRQAPSPKAQAPTAKSQPPKAARQPPTANIQKPIANPQPPTDRENWFDTPQWAALEKYRKARYVEMAKMRNNLIDMASDADRAKAWDEIQAMDEENKAIWKAMDYKKEHGVFPDDFDPEYFQKKRPIDKEPEEMEALDVLELDKLLKNSLRPAHTRAKKALPLLQVKHGLDHPKYIKKAQHMAELEMNIYEVEEKIRRYVR